MSSEAVVLQEYMEDLSFLGFELTDLVDELFALATPNYTPDGKTVLSVLQEDELEKLFK